MRDLLAVADSLFGFAPVPFKQRRWKKLQKNSSHVADFVSHESAFSGRENEPISNLLVCVTKCPHVWELPLCQSRLTRL